MPPSPGKCPRFTYVGVRTAKSWLSGTAPSWRNDMSLLYPGDRRPQNTGRLCSLFPSNNSKLRTQIKFPWTSSNPNAVAGIFPPTATSNSFHHSLSPTLGLSSLVTERVDKTPSRIPPFLLKSIPRMWISPRVFHQPSGWGWGLEILAGIWMPEGPSQSCDI